MPTGLLASVGELTNGCFQIAPAVAGQAIGVVGTMLERSLGLALAFSLAVSIASLSAHGAEREPGLSREDLSGHRIELRSGAAVQSWETAGVKVFVASEGAEIVQGSLRIRAPSMVVWFDKQESEKPAVRAAVLNVYAEGRGEEGQLPKVPAWLVEGGEARKLGALSRKLHSRVAFLWDCPLVQHDGPQPIPLFRKALHVTREAKGEFSEEAIPAGPELEEETDVLQRFKADEMQYEWDDAQDTVTAVYLGDVRGSYGAVNVRADTVVIWYDRAQKTFEIYAKGNVTLRAEADRQQGPIAPAEPTLRFTERFQQLRADEVYINPDRYRAAATDVELRLGTEGTETTREDIYVFKGEALYVLDSNNLMIREGSVTTCPFARPHYLVEGSRFGVTHKPPRTLLTVREARAQIEGRKTPLYLPFMGVDLTGKSFLIRRFKVGSSDKLGSFVNTGWGPSDLTGKPEWMQDWALDLDYYSDRGPGVGTELEYLFGGDAGATHSGELRAYYVQDKKGTDVTGLAVPRDDRGRLHLAHRSRWSRLLRTDFEYYQLSDRGFLNEFFEDDFETEKPAESYVFTRYRGGSLWGGLLLKDQVNDFLTQQEELPSLEVQLLGLPLAGWIYEGLVELGRNKLNESRFSPDADSPLLSRAHSAHRLSRPSSLGNIRLDSFVQAMGTAVSKSLRDTGEGAGAETRGGAGFGAHASIDFSRSYDTSSRLLNLNRLRHVVTPYVGYETMQVAGGRSANFIQMDEVDALDDNSKFVAGLRQRFQTKRGGPGQWHSVNFVELDVDYVNLSNDSVGYVGDDRYVEADLIVRLARGLRVHSEDNRLSLTGGPNVNNFGMSLDFSPAAAVSLDYDRISKVTSAVRAGLRCRLSDRWQATFKERYDLDSLGEGKSRNLETQIALRRILHRWFLEFGIKHDEANDDFSLLLNFSHVGKDVLLD